MIRDAVQFQGAGTLVASKHNTVQIALDVDRDASADALFRIATDRPEPMVDDLAEAIGPDSSLLVVQRRGQHYEELIISGDNGDPHAIVFFLDRRACAADSGQAEADASSARVPARAIIRETALKAGQSPGELLAERGGEPAVLRVSDLLPAKPSDQQEPVSFEPPLCRAGGQGATSCSVNLGSVGPIDLGECAASCTPPEHACCGIHAANHCACIQTEAGRQGR